MISAAECVTTHQSIAFISSLAIAAPMHMCGPWMKTCPSQQRRRIASRTWYECIDLPGLSSSLASSGMSSQPACVSSMQTIRERTLGLELLRVVTPELGQREHDAVAHVDQRVLGLPVSDTSVGDRRTR